MNKKVAILGKLDTKRKAPFNKPDWDIWTFNYHKEPLQRVTLWFDIHAKGAYPHADIKREDFPFKECESLVGGQYFNNTAAYLIAYAILQGYEEIAFYGMKFNAEHEKRRNGEYQNARELIFFAKSRGIKVSAPFDKELLTEYPLYGAE